MHYFQKSKEIGRYPHFFLGTATVFISFSDEDIKILETAKTFHRTFQSLKKNNLFLNSYQTLVQTKKTKNWTVTAFFRFVTVFITFLRLVFWKIRALTAKIFVLSVKIFA